ncbi:Hint domain-containing protein [Chelatococcus reniformis]|uniref:Hedgehog/Intein (Hint) domain-containing protein n=1 Tax=Chelatococcus reniformis TaxID=1494448 RepID=A0A916XBB6_9HYPH|nr:Hint domain-containing protein [Chelatococcus reniformis]GGC60868.1 hypothetical protein GCM10010994_19370 [Chelatococcus reniformis]
MAQKTWIGGDGNWHVAANWQPAGVPGYNDDVVIDSGNPVATSGVAIESLTVGASATLVVASMNVFNGVTNAGHIDVPNAFLTIINNYSNTGTIDVGVGAQLDLRYVDLVPADLEAIRNDGSISIGYGAALDLGGGVLDLASVGNLGTASGGTIANGRIVDDGSTETNWTGKFDDIIYQGVLNRGELNLDPGTNFTIVNSLTVLGADGQAPGTINADRTIIFDGGVQLDGVILNTSASVQTVNGTLVFGADTVVNLTGGNISMYGDIINQGHINITASRSFAYSLVNEGSIAIAPGASFTRDNLLNNGTITIEGGGTATLSGTLNGDGAVELRDGATVTIGAADAQQTVAIIAGELVLTNAAGFAATIDDFDDAADIINLANVSFDAGDTVTLLAGNVLQITQGEDGSIISLQLDPAGSYGGVPYQLVDDGAGGTDIVATCFCAGTRIATPTGERAVETLAAGDLVLTAEGETRPVLWIGRQTVATAFADPLRTSPVRIAAGALAEGVPARDLHVSPDHAMLLEGVLAQAGALVNGTTIARVAPAEARFTYFHIELADHALVLAEGAPAETFVDNVTRRRFDNYAEYEVLFGESRARMPELELPRVKSARQLPSAVRERLAVQAEALGLIHEAAA